MFGQRQRLRRLAAQVLLMWLFTLTSCVVNACMLAPGAQHAMQGDPKQQPVAQQEPHAHAPCGLADKHSSLPASKTPCAKFCEEPSANAQTVNVQPNDTFNPVWLPMGPPLTLGTPVLMEVVDTPSAEPVIWRASVPIPIAFLRLTL